MKKLLSIFLTASILLSCLSGFAVFGAEDKLLFSESFEGMSGTNLPEGWSYLGNKTGDMCSYESSLASEGKVSAKITDETAEDTAGFVSPKIEVKPQTSYVASADVYVYNGSATLFLKFFDEAGTQISYKSKSSGTKDKWSTITHNEATPEGTKYITLTVAGTKAGTTVALADNIRLTEGTAASAPAPDGKAPVLTADVLKPATDADKGVIYSCDFEGLSSSNAPAGWVYFGQGHRMISYDNKEKTKGEAALLIKDDTDSETGGITSPYIEIEAGKSYSVSANVFVVDGSASMFLKFYDKDKKQLSSKTFSVGNKNTWSILGGTGEAPDGAVYMACILGGTKAGITIANYDDFNFYNGIVKIAPIKQKFPFEAPLQKDAVTSKLVVPNGEHLELMPYNDKGDKLSDFSYAGFYAGEYELPDTSKLPLAETIEPSLDPDADDTERIQAVIDKVYNESTDDFMKVIKLKAGKYNINENGLKLKSGIVLSGEGQGPDGTILYATAKKSHNVITARGINPTIISEKVNIIDDYVKSGSDVITIDESKAGLFKKGDLITIYHPSTEEWIKGMEMDAVKDAYNNNKNSWRKDTIDFFTEREIKEIEGNKITLDFPLFVPYDKSYSQCFIYKTTDELRLKHIGVENLRIDSYYDGSFDDENHAHTGILFASAKDSFVRNVSSRHLIYAVVHCTDYAKRITVADCSNLDPVSQVAGSRRYAFLATNSAQQILTYNCYAYDARHDFATSRQVTGPIVYLDSVNDSSNDSAEPHGTWSTGVLYDNIFGISNGNDGLLAMSNRGIYGTDLSQGWTVGGGVIWNALQTLTIAHKPPLTYQNFLIGAWGVYQDQNSKNFKELNLKRVAGYYRTTNIGAADDKTPYAYTTDDTHFAGDAYMESPTAPVEPRSLFKAQLAERLTGSYKNVRAEAPVIVSPRSEETLPDTQVEFKGIMRKGAQKVTVYIDNKPYDAAIDSHSNTFTLNLTLEKGVHKIYATQTVDGVEGVKCADRFLTVIESTGNKPYLSSDSDFEKTGLILNDPRQTFDEYQKNASSEIPDIKIIMNGSQLYTDVAPFIQEGRTLVPMRAIFEALDTEVTWDDTTKTATAKNDNTVISITNNSKTVLVDGKEVALDVPATIVNGRFVVPVRFISETFGATVDWNGIKRIITITGGKALYPPLNGIPGALKIYDAIQSGDDGTGSASIRDTLDGIAKSYWGVAYDEANPMGAFGIYDLGKVKKVKNFMIQFFKGETRVYTFELYGSKDGVSYEKILSKSNSSGTSTEFESYPVSAEARYIKIVGYGNNTNKWNSISEVAIIGE